MEKKCLSDLPRVAVEYIDSVIKAMKYRRNVRIEVRQELIDHFADALADCKTNDEKQKLAEELIAEFGDVKLLGTLLRRAKKRCRPLWRTMVARAFQLVGVLFVLLVLYIGWFFSGKPVITTNYLEVLNRQVRPVADDSQNAWPFYKQAVEKYVQYEANEEREKFDFRNPSTLSTEERGFVQKSISGNQQSLDLIRQGNQRPYYWPVYDVQEGQNPELIAISIPHLKEYRRLAELLCWQGLLSAEAGRLDKAFQEVLESYSFGKHLRGQHTMLIEQLVAIALEAMSTKTLRIVLSEYGEHIDAAILEAARKRFEAEIADEDFTADFDGEKLFIYDEIQRSFTQSRIGKSHLYIKRLEQNVPALAFGAQGKLVKHWFRILFTHPGKEETLKMSEEFYSAIKANAGKTPAEIKLLGTETKADKIEKEIFNDNIFLGLLMPAFNAVISRTYRNRIDSEATLTVLAILEYQKQKGVLPENLNVLVEDGLLKEIPIDPFSDKPLVYKKTDGGFTLYSVGLNFMDDGGTRSKDSHDRPALWGEGGDAVFWPVTDS
ncbi:MAG TPA: hypothetical protein PK052_02795 [Anaerohalosphaeraceae bacterium]|nr:hypothetical protein [Anaerohalosphaeraceae bacterium]HOL30885.1 hypothetical protein [Anaerohalosphaeraceae bacterium]HOM75553.1 hypothetical protein [Anaerohalosphaeraceae bacterium]HPC64335.1 hypothetical protein [Anaerohalosphaeraceae bacterium]HPO69145.1 hypothetical protein [Anaerohalosphaeraceae bacterium]